MDTNLVPFQQKNRETVDLFFREVCDNVVEEANRILASRGKQYNDAGVRIYDYALYGSRSYMNEVWKNVLRLVSMLEQPNCGESEDNPDSFFGKVVDTVNYLRFLAAMHLLEKKGMVGREDV